jgi:hypothetical protein
MWYTGRNFELFSYLISLKLWGFNDSFIFDSKILFYSIQYYSESMSPVFVELVTSSILCFRFFDINSMENATSVNKLKVCINIKLQNNRNTKWTPNGIEYDWTYCRTHMLFKRNKVPGCCAYACAAANAAPHGPQCAGAAVFALRWCKK